MDTSRPQRLIPAWLGPVCVSGSFYLALMSLYLIPFHGDPGAFVCLPQKWVGEGPFEAVHIANSPVGYDGTFYYAIATNPFDIPVSYVDAPCFRHCRLLYPLLAWVLSGGGDAYRLIWVLPLINLLAVLGLTWLGCKIAQHYGRSAWWGLLLSIGMNTNLPAFRDLTDPLAAMAAVGLLASWLLRWPTWLMIGWGVASVLSREQNMAIVAIVGLDVLVRRDWRRTAGLALVVSVWIGWLLILRSIYSTLPTPGDNLNTPFQGLHHAWTHLVRPGSIRISREYLGRILVLTLSLLAVPIVVVRSKHLTTKMVALAAAWLAIVAGIAIYEDFWSYMRVLNWLPLTMWLYGVQNDRRWTIGLLAPSALWPCLEVRTLLRGTGVFG